MFTFDMWSDDLVIWHLGIPLFTGFLSDFFLAGLWDCWGLLWRFPQCSSKKTKKDPYIGIYIKKNNNDEAKTYKFQLQKKYSLITCLKTDYNNCTPAKHFWIQTNISEKYFIPGIFIFWYWFKWKCFAGS